MTKKRKHNGHRVRGKTRGKITRVTCVHCGNYVAKDKAVIKYSNRPIVSSNILKDIQDASVYENYRIPKIYQKLTVFQIVSTLVFNLFRLVFFLT